MLGYNNIRTYVLVGVCLMNRGHERIISQLTKRLNIEQIYVLDLKTIILFLVVWNENKSSFRKRVQIRRIFYSADIEPDTPYDIISLTSQELETTIQNGDMFISNIVYNGDLLYEKEDYEIENSCDI